MDKFDVALHNQIVCLAKALGEHGIILNYDDAQMGRVSPKIITEWGIPLSKVYPIQVPKEVKDQIAALGLRDFWEFYFDKETKIAQKAEQKRKNRQNRKQKKRWVF